MNKHTTTSSLWQRFNTQICALGCGQKGTGENMLLKKEILTQQVLCFVFFVRGQKTKNK